MVRGLRGCGGKFTVLGVRKAAPRIDHCLHVYRISGGRLVAGGVWWSAPRDVGREWHFGAAGGDDCTLAAHHCCFFYASSPAMVGFGPSYQGDTSRFTQLYPLNASLNFTPLISPICCLHPLPPTPTLYPSSVNPQYRKGAPSAFGILRYKGTPAGVLPATPVLQPEAASARKWDAAKIMSVSITAFWMQ